MPVSPHFAFADVQAVAGVAVVAVAIAVQSVISAPAFAVGGGKIVAQSVAYGVPSSVRLFAVAARIVLAEPSAQLDDGLVGVGGGFDAASLVSPVVHGGEILRKLVSLGFEPPSLHELDMRHTVALILGSEAQLVVPSSGVSTLLSDLMSS